MEFYYYKKSIQYDCKGLQSVGEAKVSQYRNVCNVRSVFELTGQFIEAGLKNKHKKYTLHTNIHFCFSALVFLSSIGDR